MAKEQRKDPRDNKDAKAQEAANMNVIERAAANKDKIQADGYKYHKTSEGGVWKKSGSADVINLATYS